MSLPLHHRLPTPAALLLIGALAPAGAAAIDWRGDFEQAGFDNWSHVLNPQGVERVTEHAAEGDYAARIVIRGEPDYLWNADPALNRVELQHRPDAERTAEGADLFFGWSFMIPRPLTNARHEFGYWESAGSYRQMMRFNLHGETISFQFSAGDTPVWKAEGAVTPMRWHDIAMHIHWSADPARGRVSVWFDGERVVDRARGRTRVESGDPMFIQLGLLRTRRPDVETLYLDNARQARDIRTLLNGAPAH